MPRARRRPPRAEPVRVWVDPAVALAAAADAAHAVSLNPSDPRAVCRAFRRAIAEVGRHTRALYADADAERGREAEA